VNQHSAASSEAVKCALKICELPSPRAKAFELASETFALVITAPLANQSLVSRARIAGTCTHLRRAIGTLILFLIIIFDRLASIKLVRFFSTSSRGEAATDFRGDDAPTIVFVLCHSVAKF
jgi:hypothetical protein